MGYKLINKACWFWSCQFGSYRLGMCYTCRSSWEAH